MATLEQVGEAAHALEMAGRFQEALAIWDRAGCVSPTEPSCLVGMATNLLNMGLNAAGSAILRLCVEHNPELSGAWYLLAQGLRKQQDNEAARFCYDEALKRENPDSLKIHIYTGYAGSYVNMGNPEDGLKWAEKALEIDPEFSHAVNAKALLLLEAGRWKEGWVEYEKRWKLPAYSVRDYPGLPQWDGKSKVETLFIHEEQGLGDEILFLSCVPDLFPYADKIVGECQGRLIELFRRSFPQVTWYATPQEVVASEEYAAADPNRSAWFRMGDLPKIFRSEPKDCPGTPFLKADPIKVAGYKARLRALGPGPYIGFSWKGGTADTHERVRNAPKEKWRALIEKCPGTPVSIQYGPGEKLGLAHWQSAIDDLDEFAALLASLDLVVSCCGAAVHFAGGLGVPCWVSTPVEKAWRYSAGMPWYSSVSLYEGSWEKVFYGLGYDLERLSRKAA